VTFDRVASRENILITCSDTDISAETHDWRQTCRVTVHGPVTAWSRSVAVANGAVVYGVLSAGYLHG